MNYFLNRLLSIPVALAADTTGKDSGGVDVLGFIFSQLPYWLTAITVFFVFMIIGWLLKSSVESKLASKVGNEEHKEMQIMTGRIVFVSILLIGLSVALTIAGINMMTIIAALGFGISFGMQDMVANFIAGLYLLASRHFAIGDWVTVGDKIGKVEEIGSRATILRTYDGLKLIVANSVLFKGQITSFTSNPMRRLKVPVYTRYYVNLKDVVTICLNVVRSNPKIFLEPKPTVVVKDMADYYMEFELRFWVDSKSYWKRIQSEIFYQIERKIEEAGFEAPYPVTSLSFEPEIEDYALKTKTLSPEEYNNMLNARGLMEDEYNKKRAELLKLQAAIQKPFVADLPGTAFIKTENPAVAVPLAGAQPSSAVPGVQISPETPVISPSSQVPVTPPNPINPQP